MEPIQRPKCKHHPNNELNIHCFVHNYMVCFTCATESHKTCFENKHPIQNQLRNSTMENILTKAKDLKDTRIDSLQNLEEWKITAKQEIEHLRECINAKLDQIQSRSVETMENIYREERQMRKKSLLDIEQIKRKETNLEDKSIGINENNECLDEIYKRLDCLNLSYAKRRPTFNREMKTILAVVHKISCSKIDMNSDMIIRVLTEPEDFLVRIKGQRDSDGSDFCED